MTQRLFGQGSRTGDEHWISVSDMMAGLMIIFLFIAITYIRPIVEVQSQIREIVVAWQDSEVEIHKSLNEEFKYDLPRWAAELDRETLSIRFKAPDVLFASAAAELRPKFKRILEDFFPRYLLVLERYRNTIAEVRLEGHTSSEWDRAETEDEAYFHNMELSQARTRAVLEYCLGLQSVRPSRKWARKLITANGLSSSRLIFRGSREDSVASRRVEFRVLTNTKEQIVKILETVQ